MSYAQRAELEAAFSATEIANLEQGGGNVDGALDAASQEADSYLATRYAVPLAAPAPEHLVTVVCDIARYRLYSSAGTDEVKTRYSAAVAWLKDVSRGAALLPGIALMAGEGAQVPGQVPGRFGRATSGYDWCAYD